MAKKKSKKSRFGQDVIDGLTEGIVYVREEKRNAQRRLLAHEYVCACLAGGHFKNNPPESDAAAGLEYADYLIAATSSKDEAQS